MKTKHLLMASGILLSSIISNVYAQSTIEPLIEPGKSRGFTAWNSMGSTTTYRVEVYTKSSTGATSLLASLNTSVNYIQMDPLLFTLPDVYYKVIAIRNGLVVTESSLTPNWIQQGQGTDYQTQCVKICNGRTTAWKMTNGAERTYAGPDNNGNPTYTLGNKRLNLRPAYQYYNAQAGTYVPYWQAVDHNVYDQMIASGHPYAQLTASGHPIYQKSSISANISAGPFRDAGNNVVLSGWLIEKKMDEYSYMDGMWTTQSSDAGLNICTSPLSTNGTIAPWISFFNDHKDITGFIPPANVSPFFNAGVTPSTIGCLPAFGNPPVGPSNPNGNWNEWVNNLHKQAAKVEADLKKRGVGKPITLGDFGRSIDEFSAIVSTDGLYISGITINSIAGKKDVGIEYKKKSDKYEVVNNVGTILPGLYAIMLFTSDGNAIPTVFEIANEIKPASQDEYTTLVVAPNPVVNGQLTVLTQATINVNAQLFVHNLDGTQVFTAPLTLVKDQPLTTIISVNGISIPMNQLRVSLILADGSVLQETALVP